MKKCLAMVFLFVSCLVLSACNNEYKLIENSLSEIRYNIYAGESNNFSVTFMSGKRETDYVINGYNTKLVDFGVLTITLNQEINLVNPQFALTIDTLRYEDILETNPFDGTLVADIKTLINTNNDISLKIIIGDINEDIKLTCISKGWKINHNKALKIAYKNLSKDLKPYISTEFKGETYIKIIKDTISNNNSYFWYVNFVSRDGITHSIIINPLTGEILAKK